MIISFFLFFLCYNFDRENVLQWNVIWLVIMNSRAFKMTDRKWKEKKTISLTVIYFFREEATEHAAWRELVKKSIWN